MRHWTTCWSCSWPAPPRWRTIEALDRTGLWGRLLPEWAAVRDLPPRDVSHKWTVDRHIVEIAVHAAPSVHSRGAAGSACARRAAARHRQGPGRRPQRGRRRAGHADRSQAWASRPRTPSCSRIWSATTCCCPSRPPGAICTTPTPSRACRRPWAGIRCCWSCCSAGRGGLAGHRPGGVERLEGLPDRRPGAALPAADGRRAPAAVRSDRAPLSFAGRRPRGARGDQRRVTVRARTRW